MASAPSLGDRVRNFLIFLLFASTLEASNYYVTIAGLGGTPDYEAQFTKWASDLDHEFQTNGPDAHVITLSGVKATRENIQDTLSKLATQVQPDDAFALLLVGHGTFDGTDYKFNIPGRDISAAELATLLNHVGARRQLIVNTTSCSGASLAAFARKNRIVVSATKSGTERNAPVFMRYWIDALRDQSADTDKNGTISALEAFRYAQSKTAAYFESEKLLATEHAEISDTGTTTAARDPKSENGQGLLAAAFPLIRPPIAQGNTGANPEKRRLIAKKQDLEAKIDRLKYEKAAMPENEYKQQLGALLLELARTQAEIDR
jgi:hypothetical protein